MANTAVNGQYATASSKPVDSGTQTEIDNISAWSIDDASGAEGKYSSNCTAGGMSTITGAEDWTASITQLFQDTAANVPELTIGEEYTFRLFRDGAGGVAGTDYYEGNGRVVRNTGITVDTSSGEPISRTVQVNRTGKLVAFGNMPRLFPDPP